MYKSNIDRLFFGLCVAMLFGGLAMYNELPQQQMIGLTAVGFAIGAIGDLFLAVLRYFGF
jgi:hypothetical protein